MKFYKVQWNNSRTVLYGAMADELQKRRRLADKFLIDTDAPIENYIPCSLSNTSLLFFDTISKIKLINPYFIYYYYFTNYLFLARAFLNLN